MRLVLVRPRNGHTYVAGIVARISGCQYQKEVSLEDQADHGKETAQELADGPFEYRIISTKGKGERLDRPELDEIEKMVRSRELDFLILEDMGRLVRGVEAARLCGIAVDHGTRVVAPNDCIDTNDENWEEDVISACRDHLGHNSHTSKRIKKKLMMRFRRSGGAVPLPIYGYIKPEGAKRYEDWIKDPASEPIYQEWGRRLFETLNGASVAEWLNRTGVTTGLYARSKTWTGPMVLRITRNPILKGFPGRGFRHTIKFNENGRRISVPNPDGPVYFEAPHLAHFEPVFWDELNRRLTEQNAHFRRKLVNGHDPLFRVSRRTSRFPSGHARCWYCGHAFVWGANGITEHLMCSGSRKWNCWNSIGFSGEIAASRIVEAITTELYRLDGFDVQFRALTEHALREGGVDNTQRWEKLHQRESRLHQRQENLTAAIAEFGTKPMFKEKVAELDLEERDVARERWELTNLAKRKLNLPASVAEMRSLLEVQFRELAIGSEEFGALMRRLVPEFWVYLVRLVDGGHPLPRARVRIDLGSAIPDIARVPELSQHLTRELTIDLFERPTQRERIRADVVRLTAECNSQRKIGHLLAEKPKQAAVQRALELDRMLRERGLGSPYINLDEPPDDYPRLRRHKNPKYRFKSLEGYERQPI